MNKFLTYALLLLAGFLIGFFLKGCGDKKKPTNETKNIEVATDSLKVIQDYPRQIAIKEAIIMDLQKAVSALEKQSKKKGDLYDELASKIRQKNDEIERLGGEIQALQFIVATMKVIDTASIETIEEPGKDPVYFSIFKDSTEWYNATVFFDLVAERGSLSLIARDEYTLTDYIGSDGVEYFQVENSNPFVKFEPATNLFKKPIPIPAKPKKNLLGALYGRSTDGRELYSVLYGRRFLKSGKVFIQGVYDRKELSGLAGVGFQF